MPLPGNVGTGTVTGKFTKADGTAASGKVYFVPPVSWLLDSSANVVVVLNQIVVTLDGTGSFSQVLVATDDPDLSPVDWTWTVRVDLDGKPPYHFGISVPAGTTSDLADIAPVPIVAGTMTLVPSDGDYGDITVSGDGTIWSIDSGAVGTVQLANSSVTAAKVAADVATQAELDAVEAMIDSLVITGGGMAPSTASQVRVGTDNLTAVTPLALHDGLPFVTTFIGSLPFATVFGGPDSDVDVAASSRFWRPHVGVIGYGDFDEVPSKWHVHGAVQIFERNDSPEVIGRRSTGQFVDGGVDTFTTLAVAISSPFSSVTSITATDLHNGTVAWLDSGVVMVDDVAGSTKGVWEYTSINRATGVISGLTFLNGSSSGTLPVGANVQSMIVNNTNLLLAYGQADMGIKGGFQDRSAYWTVFTSEAHRPDDGGHYYSAGHHRWGTSSPGPQSQRKEQVILDEKGSWAMMGSALLDKSAMLFNRRFQVSPKYTRASAAFTLPSATVPVLDPSGFPTAGIVKIASTAGDQLVSYTGYAVNAGRTAWELTGCTGGTGDVALQAFVRLTKESPGIILGAKFGNIAAQDDGSSTTVIIGAVGPTVGAGQEAGIQFGVGSGVVTLYRGASSELWTSSRLSFKMGSGSSDGMSVYITGEANPRYSVRVGGPIWGAGGGSAQDARIVRTNTAELGVRNLADSADADFKMARARITGPMTHTGTTWGEYGATPASQSTGWGSPTGTTTKTTFDTATVTTAQLAERVKGLIDYFKLRGSLAA